jgi:two-component system nitrogen regulation response regulator GlnG/two-component system response regulator HydG
VHHDDKTAPAIATTSVLTERSASVLGLVLLWSRDEPGRVGQVALVPRPLGFGRRAEGAPIAELACFAWQSPGEPLPPPSIGGLLSGESISRLQLRLTPTAVALEVVNEGRCEMLVNGKACRKAILRPGDDLMLKGEVALLCVRRPAVMPALRAARVAHARGEPDEVGIVGGA